jgi:excisionase family DNA binding protein
MSSPASHISQPPTSPLPVRWAAEIAGINKTVLYEAIAARELSVVMFGTRMHLRNADLSAYIDRLPRR